MFSKHSAITGHIKTAITQSAQKEFKEIKQIQRYDKVYQISALTLVLNTVYFDKVTVSLCQMQTLDSDRQLPGLHRFYEL